MYFPFRVLDRVDGPIIRGVLERGPADAAVGQANYPAGDKLLGLEIHDLIPVIIYHRHDVVGVISTFNFQLSIQWRIDRRRH